MKGPTGYITYGGKWFVENNPYEVDPSKVEFLKEITAARTGFAKDYLAYGRMVRPLKIKSTPISLSYFYYNIPGSNHKKGEHGVFTTKSILHSAWMFKDGKLGFLFVNLQDKEVSVNIRIDPREYGLIGKSGYALHYVTAEKK